MLLTVRKKVKLKVATMTEKYSTDLNNSLNIAKERKMMDFHYSDFSSSFWYIEDCGNISIKSIELNDYSYKVCGEAEFILVCKIKDNEELPDYICASYFQPCSMYSEWLIDTNLILNTMNKQDFNWYIDMEAI